MHRHLHSLRTQSIPLRKETLRQPLQLLSYPNKTSYQQRRAVSSYYAYETHQGSRTVKARIPLLKSPGYIGHYTSRVNRPYNEDRYYAGVLELPAGSSLRPLAHRRQNARGADRKTSSDTDDNTIDNYDADDSTDSVRQVFNFAVFDGHGGSQCSQFLQDNLAKYVENCDLTTGSEIAEEYRKQIGGYWRRWKNGFDSYMAKMRAIDDLQMRIPIAFLQADLDFINMNTTAGSTCTSVYMYTDEEYQAPVGRHQILTPGAFWQSGQTVQLVVAHVGDTRCVMCDRFGEAHPLTSNHHPSSPIEALRLQRYASSFMTDSFGESRFGNYANTRAFGDLQAKALGITAEPDITEYEVGTYSGKSPAKKGITAYGGSGDESFLVIVSDGVTSMMSDQEIVDIVMSTENRGGSRRGTPQLAAEEVVKYAEALGGDDNATCMVIRLGGWTKWPAGVDRTAALREQRLKDALDNRRQ